VFPFPIATPQGCNIQTFYGTENAVAAQTFTWNKPVGVSHVYMMLIGGGSNGGINPGSSGAVTVWYGAAQHVPDSLVLNPSIPAANTVVYYRGTLLVALLTASGAIGTTGGLATTAGPFAASGFYKSTAGQNAGSSGITPSTTTFLSGGATNSVTANYGYEVKTTSAGFFLMQPIIVGSGGSSTRNGGIGCGGGLTSGKGGPGMVLIASW
jgi:hypothetical protein